MLISVLDAATLGDDIDLSPLAAVGKLTVYPTTVPAELTERLAACEVAVVNKIKIGREALAGAPALRLVCVTATGYDNIDLAACREHGVAVCNVVGYSTESVVAVTVATVLSLATHLLQYRASVADGTYTAGGVANRLTPVYHELAGKTWGVLGYGNIGRRVADVARSLGCRVLAYKRTPEAGVEVADLDRICRESDILTVHLPLSSETRGLLGERELALMKKGAILVNEARGAVTDEAAVAKALLSGRLGGLGADVYSVEPMPEDHPFYPIRDRENVCLTPHMAWGALEARARCIREIAANIAAFLAGERRCRVD